jgi:hypothetical protein
MLESIQNSRPRGNVGSRGVIKSARRGELRQVGYMPQSSLVGPQCQYRVGVSTRVRRGELRNNAAAGGQNSEKDLNEYEGTGGGHGSGGCGNMLGGAGGGGGSQQPEERKYDATMEPDNSSRTVTEEYPDQDSLANQMDNLNLDQEPLDAQQPQANSQESSQKSSMEHLIKAYRSSSTSEVHLGFE